MNPPTSSRKRRRVRRRIRRSVATLFVVSILAVGFLVLPAGGTSQLGTKHYSGDTSASITDIQSFWGRTLPAVYAKSYRAIPDDHIHPYSPQNPPPACGGRGTTPYPQVAGNAFYCGDGDFIAYDEQALIPNLRKQFGDFAVGLVLAHEWGHAIQSQVRFSSRTSVYVELQADCFAGAWAGHIASGESALALSEDDLDRALAGFLALRDPSGVDGREAGAHGNAFDRVGAFEDGLVGGAAACKGYASNPPEVTEAGFTSYEDQAINGDLPLEEVLPILKASLDDFWSGSQRAYKTTPKLSPTASTRVPSCDGTSDGGVLIDTVIYCAGTNAIVYSSRTLQNASDTIGDLGAGVYVAAAWSSSVQYQLGQKLGSTRARAAAECLTGAWAGAVQNGSGSGRSQEFSFSPGDLDEVVATFIAADGSQSSVDRGSVFDRVAKFRTGFEQGAAACVAA